LNLQIFGTKKCSNTKKAEMFFKERRIKFQLINLSEKPMSKGELTSILSSVTLDDLIDINSKLYKEKNLQYMKFDKMEMLLEFPLLLKTPIVRDGKKATVGFQPDVWKTWIV
jgi:arsenate reductase (glutaredoxin)